MTRSTKQIDFGTGETWTFDASETITSGIAVQLDGGDVKLAHYSTSTIGVTLLPASINKWASVVMEGVVQMLITGGDGTAGQYVKASVGHALPYTPTSLTMDSLAIGVLLETKTNGNRGLIKLTL